MTTLVALPVLVPLVAAALMLIVATLLVVPS